MLTLQLTDDDTVEKEIFGDTMVGEKVALMDCTCAIGVCVFNFSSGKIIIRRVGLLQSRRGERVGDFFIRSLLFKFSLSNIEIVVPFVEPRLIKFGFLQVGDAMLAQGCDIVFPSACGHCKA